MCPGAILSTTRVGNYYSGRTSNFAANRALAATGRGFAAPYGRQFVPPHNKFVVLDTDEATGTTEISLSPQEQVTVSADESGGLIVTISPTPVAEPVEDEPVAVSTPV
jgi:hypothetical protein